MCECFALEKNLINSNRKTKVCFYMEHDVQRCEGRDLAGAIRWTAKHGRGSSFLSLGREMKLWCSRKELERVGENETAVRTPSNDPKLPPLKSSSREECEMTDMPKKKKKSKSSRKSGKRPGYARFSPASSDREKENKANVRTKLCECTIVLLMV